MKIIRICFVVAMLMAASCATVKNYPLVKDGKAVSAIIVKNNAPNPVKFSAKELARFLAKLSAGEAVKIGDKAEPGLYNIYLGTIADKDLVRTAGIDAGRLEAEGFAISAGRGGLYIIGADSHGIIYGTYEILKKYGGVRWLYPGDEGEYFTVRKTIAVPGQLAYTNPYLQVRNAQVGASSMDDLLWSIRNNASFAMALAKRNKEFKVQCDEIGCVICDAFGYGHILGPLVLGEDRKKPGTVEKLFSEHPEYFPLIDGQRKLV